MLFFNADNGYNVDDFGTIGITNSNNYYYPISAQTATIGDESIDYYGAAHYGNNGGSSAYDAYILFTSNELVDITSYRKLVVKGTFRGTHNGAYYYQQVAVNLIDANGTTVAMPSLATSGNNQDVAIDTNLDVTQYNGLYKVQVKLAFRNQWGVDNTQAAHFYLNELYFE